MIGDRCHLFGDAFDQVDWTAVGLHRAGQQLDRVVDTGDQAAVAKARAQAWDGASCMMPSPTRTDATAILALDRVIAEDTPRSLILRGWVRDPHGLAQANPVAVLAGFLTMTVRPLQIGGSR